VGYFCSRRCSYSSLTWTPIRPPVPSLFGGLVVRPATFIWSLILSAEPLPNTGKLWVTPAPEKNPRAQLAPIATRNACQPGTSSRLAACSFGRDAQERRQISD
jgi:hypothetical protein